MDTPPAPSASEQMGAPMSGLLMCARRRLMTVAGWRVCRTSAGSQVWILTCSQLELRSVSRRPSGGGVQRMASDALPRLRMRLEAAERMSR